MPGSTRSSAYLPAPVTLSGPSIIGTRAPTSEVCDVDRTIRIPLTRPTAAVSRSASGLGRQHRAPHSQPAPLYTSQDEQVVAGVVIFVAVQLVGHFPGVSGNGCVAEMIDIGLGQRAASHLGLPNEIHVTLHAGFLASSHRLEAWTLDDHVGIE